MLKTLALLRNTFFKFVNLAIVIAAVTGFSAWAADRNAADAAVQEQIEAAEHAANRGPYANDGTWEGSAKGYGGTVTMSVTIKDGYIDSVDIVDVSHEDEAWLKMCQDIPAAIKKAQSPQVDTISSATFTSTGMINAVKKAIQKEEAGE